MMLKTIIKKHVLSVALTLVGLGLVANANAAIDGAYLGGQLGYNNVVNGQDYNSNTVTYQGLSKRFNHNNAKDQGIAGRVFGGYQVNQNLAAELGYARLHNANQSYKQTNSSGATTASNSTTLKTHVVDLVAKGIIPLESGFNVYGKAGVALVHGIQDNKSFKSGLISDTNVASSKTLNKIYPTFGAGVGYDLTQNLSADLSWNRIQKTGHSTVLDSTNFYAAGLAYHFG